MGGFLNNSQIETFLANWEVVVLEIFLMEFIVCMYWKVCVRLNAQETPEGVADYFIHDDRQMIPKDDVLIVLGLPPDFKKDWYGESAAEHFLFNDFVKKK